MILAKWKIGRYSIRSLLVATTVVAFVSSCIAWITSANRARAKEQAVIAQIERACAFVAVNPDVTGSVIDPRSPHAPPRVLQVTQEPVLPAGFQPVEKYSKLDLFRRVTRITFSHAIEPQVVSELAKLDQLRSVTFNYPWPNPGIAADEFGSFVAEVERFATDHPNIDVVLPKHWNEDRRTGIDDVRARIIDFLDQQKLGAERVRQSGSWQSGDALLIERGTRNSSKKTATKVVEQSIGHDDHEPASDGMRIRASIVATPLTEPQGLDVIADWKVHRSNHLLANDAGVLCLEISYGPEFPQNAVDRIVVLAGDRATD